MVWSQVTRSLTWRLGPPLRVQMVDFAHAGTLPPTGLFMDGSRGRTVTTPLASTEVRPPGSGTPFSIRQAGDPLAAGPELDGSAANAAVARTAARAALNP